MEDASSFFSKGICAGRGSSPALLPKMNKILSPLYIMTVGIFFIFFVHIYGPSFLEGGMPRIGGFCFCLASPFCVVIFVGLLRLFYHCPVGFWSELGPFLSFLTIIILYGVNV